MKGKNINAIQLLGEGKVPPQAIDAEASVLGTCLVYPDALSDVRLKPEMFYRDAHKIIFTSLLECSGRGPCDITIVTEDLRKKGLLDKVGGPVAITELTSRIFTDQMIQTHALLVRQTYLAREYIRIGYQIAAKGYTEDLSDITEFAESSLLELSDFTQVKEPRHISYAIDSLLGVIEKIQNKEKSLAGVPSGFNDIDRITGGWQPGSLQIIAGRPSMGKTAFSLALAYNCASLGYPVCIFSLEMSDGELASRYLSGASDYSNTQIRTARVDLNKLCADSNVVANLPIYADDTPAITLFELRSKIKKMILRHGIKMVIIDYLQLMTAQAGSREQEVSVISRGLKGISKEFNVPVMALSQLNRAVEERVDKRPRLSDLRESGAIEQDADMVCFVYRPAYYGIKKITFDGKEVDTERLMILDCAKNRNGALFSRALYHNDSLTVIKEN